MSSTDHNRIHAADVLHGVYYMTTQPVPGFHQLTSAECDSCLKPTSLDNGQIIKMMLNRSII